MDFVDLHGASGQAYRFRAWPAVGRHPPMAGNYVALRAQTREVVAVGVLDNLADARSHVESLGPGVELFTRLNVSRVDREADQADLAAAHATGSNPAAA
jgi:hypothetical protein